MESLSLVLYLYFYSIDLVVFITCMYLFENLLSIDVCTNKSSTNLVSILEDKWIDCFVEYSCALINNLHTYYLAR